MKHPHHVGKPLKHKLETPVAGMRPSQHPGASAILAAYEGMSFQARNLGKAATLMTTMARDKSCLKVLTMAGALIPGGLKQVVMEMIEHRLVDVIISTGANMTHDWVEGCGQHHYRHCDLADDKELQEARVNRIYDTFLDEQSFRAASTILMETLPKLGGQTVTSRQITKLLGDTATVPCVLSAAAKHDVPVYIPALNDSELGMGVNRYNLKVAKKGKQVTWDALADNADFADVFRKGDKAGIVILGGGVPRNWAQQVTPLLEYLNFELSDLEHGFDGYHYGLQITTDTPVYGGMSGCTFSESVSWGKYEAASEYVTVNCDITIALPLIVAASLERLKNGSPEPAASAGGDHRHAHMHHHAPEAKKPPKADGKAAKKGGKGK
jgi:deoxyhypusine synthase